MIDQYPDTLTYAGPQGPVNVPCRFVPNIRGHRVRRTTDGTEVDYEFDIAFPLGTAHILAGTIVTAMDRDGNFLVYETELLQFHTGQLHNRGWV